MDKLLELMKAELQALADEKGIAYTARTTNQALAEMIHAHNEKAEQDENAQDANVSQTVAETAQKIDADYQSLLDDDSFMVVAGQTLIVITKQNGELIQGLIDADIIIDGSGQRIIQFEQENRDLKSLNVFLEDAIKNKDLEIADLKKTNAMLDAVNKSLDEENDKLAIKVVQSAGMVSESTIVEASTNKPVWNNDVEALRVRVRITPNKGVTSRIRASMKFGVQYSEHEIDKATFDALIADSYLQVEILESKADG